MLQVDKVKNCKMPYFGGKDRMMANTWKIIRYQRT